MARSRAARDPARQPRPRQRDIHEKEIQTRDPDGFCKRSTERPNSGRYAGRTSWMLTCWLARVTCRGSRERARGRGSGKEKERGKERERKWVECAPRRRMVQVGDRRVRLLRMAYTGGAFATGILDPRLEGSLSRIRHAGAARTLSLFLPRRHASPLSVLLTPACLSACSPVPARPLLLTLGGG
jgi:hypothetical protein